jgi:hypothetical protein
VLLKALARRLTDQLERARASERILTLKDLGSFAKTAGSACVGRVKLGPDRSAVDYLAAFWKTGDVCDRVMDDCGVAGPQLDRLNPPVLLERDRHLEVLHRSSPSAGTSNSTGME